MLLINKRISMYLPVENLDRKGTPASIKKERGKKSSNNFHRLFPLETKISHKSSRSSFSFPLRQSERKCVTLKRFWGDSRIRFFNQFLFGEINLLPQRREESYECVYIISMIPWCRWCCELLICTLLIIKNWKFCPYLHFIGTWRRAKNINQTSSFRSLRKAWKRVRCS